MPPEDIAKAAKKAAAAAAPSLPPCGPGLVTFVEMKQELAAWVNDEAHSAEGEAAINKLIADNGYVKPYAFKYAGWSALSNDNGYAATYSATASCETPECQAANPTWKEGLVAPLGEAQFDLCEDAAVDERSLPKCEDALTTGGCSVSTLTFTFNDVKYTTCESFAVDLRKVLEPFGDRGTQYDQCSSDSDFARTVQECCQASCGLCESSTPTPTSSAATCTTVAEMKQELAAWVKDEAHVAEGEAAINKLIADNGYVKPYAFKYAGWSALSNGNGYAATYSATASCETPECQAANPTWKEALVAPLGEAEFGNVCS